MAEGGAGGKVVGHVEDNYLVWVVCRIVWGRGPGLGEWNLVPPLLMMWCTRWEGNPFFRLHLCSLKWILQLWVHKKASNVGVWGDTGTKNPARVLCHAIKVTLGYFQRVEILWKMPFRCPPLTLMIGLQASALRSLFYDANKKHSNHTILRQFGLFIRECFKQRELAWSSRGPLVYYLVLGLACALVICAPSCVSVRCVFVLGRAHSSPLLVLACTCKHLLC